MAPHAPVSALSFPLCNDPQNQKQFQRRNVAAQVDERMLLAEARGDPPVEDPGSLRLGSNRGDDIQAIVRARLRSPSTAPPAPCRSG